MIKLPPNLERRLKEIFPLAGERESFVSGIIEDAIKKEDLGSGIEAVGGTLHLFTDGGSRGNPGQAAVGCILEDPVEGKVIREHAERIGIQTNNVAEYRALIEGLKIARRYHPNRLVCFLDSELIVRQLKGEYRIKMDALKEYVSEILELVREFSSVEFNHIPRSDNFRADDLVKKALDAHPSPHYDGNVQ